MSCAADGSRKTKFGLINHKVIDHLDKSVFRVLMGDEIMLKEEQRSISWSTCSECSFHYKTSRACIEHIFKNCIIELGRSQRIPQGAKIL